MVDLYVYYKVRDEDAARLAPLVRAMQGRLADDAGGPARFALKRRPPGAGAVQTWMEVYPSVPESFATALERAVAGAGLDHLLAGPRHTETFTDLPPCA